LHDNYVDNSALLYIWAEQQPLASRATAARSAAVARPLYYQTWGNARVLLQTVTEAKTAPKFTDAL